jgi:hypothetical protein
MSAIMKYIKDIELNEKSNFSKRQDEKIGDLVEEIYNRSNIVNWLQDEGYMDETGHAKGDFTVDDVRSGISDQFEVSWKSIADMEGEFKDLLSACEELAKLYPANKFEYSK